MIFKDVILSDNDKRYCEHWLVFWTALNLRLTQPHFTEERLRKLLVYELRTRRREHVLQRLAGRHSRLRRIREWDEIEGYLNYADQRECDRGVSSQESKEDGRNSD